MSGSAKQLFDKAQEAEKNGNPGRAIKAYRAIVKHHPKDTLAPGSAYRLAQLLEQSRSYLRAAEAYATLVEKYPKSERFEESIEALFRIGEMYMAGHKIKILGITIKSSMESAIQIFTEIVRSAPYGKYIARDHFAIEDAVQQKRWNDARVACYSSARKS